MIHEKIIKKLQENGHTAYLAGGCVRDMLLGLDPNDYDVATSATPDEVIKIFNKTIPVGKNFGVVIVVEDNEQIEVATFRKDVGIDDGRHPQSIEFCSAEEDAKRRDFTINGLFYDIVNKKMIDYVDGQRDIIRGLIKFIGNPEDRINEDKLRMLRAIRFLGKYEFHLDEETENAIKRNACKIIDVSQERITEELKKILTNNNSDVSFLGLIRTTLLCYILPELYTIRNIRQPEKFHPEGDVWQHTMIVISKLSIYQNFELSLAGLLHDIGKSVTQNYDDGKMTFHGHADVSTEITKRICDRLKLSNDSKDKIVWLVENHMMPLNIENIRKSKLKCLMASIYYEDLIKLHEADCNSTGRKIKSIEIMKKKYAEFIEEGKLPQPLINGKDLIDFGLKPGPSFSKILKEIRNLQLDGKINIKDEAINFMKENKYV